MPSQLPNKLMSKLPGQSGHALPTYLRQIWGHLRRFALQKNSEPFRSRTTAAPAVKPQRKRRESNSCV